MTNNWALIIVLMPLLLLIGCQSLVDLVTCQPQPWSVSCGLTSFVQDSRSSNHGVRDEKPDRTFQEPPL